MQRHTDFTTLASAAREVPLEAFINPAVVQTSMELEVAMDQGAYSSNTSSLLRQPGTRRSFQEGPSSGTRFSPTTQSIVDSGIDITASGLFPEASRSGEVIETLVTVLRDDELLNREGARTPPSSSPIPGRAAAIFGAYEVVRRPPSLRGEGSSTRPGDD